MEMKKLKVACSPLTSTIFAGHTLKEGVFAAGKQDVTDDAVSAVAQHLLQTDTFLQFNFQGAKYKLAVTKII